MAGPSESMAGSSQSLPSPSMAGEPETGQESRREPLEIEQGRSTSERLASKVYHFKDRAHEERDEFRGDISASKAAFKAWRPSALATP